MQSSSLPSSGQELPALTTNAGLAALAGLRRCRVSVPGCRLRLEQQSHWYRRCRRALREKHSSVYSVEAVEWDGCGSK